LAKTFQPSLKLAVRLDAYPGYETLWGAITFATLTHARLGYSVCKDEHCSLFWLGTTHKKVLLDKFYH